MKSKDEEYKKSITMIEILALIVSIVIILLIGTRSLKVTSYEITYNGINCPTPYVIFYSNGKYDYYQYYITQSEPKPLKGKYKFDINRVIENIDKYEENEYGPYTIKVSTGETYTTYNSNRELMELFSKTGISLERCMSYQE